MAKYFANTAGKLKEVQPITTSAGVGDANKIVQTDSAGRFDISLMPVGIGAEVSIMPSSENLIAGDFVNIYLNAAAANARKADATANTKPASGFVLANVTSPANATVYGISTKNTALSALTIGSEYYLATTAGTITTTAPSATGNVVQFLGKSESATAMVYSGRGTYDFELI